ncbi:uncharacterized protein KRP23_11241 [Phytophthora ramorum]|uniref:uncharacterized protein n=1 Tax=Phytophthora ramorum TaxID=164328 RepID=UPI00309F9CB5|nr:hypothetical protein KRP23_11241 [Phytophthora ramorum]
MDPAQRSESDEQPVKRTIGEAGVAGAAPAPSDGRHEAAHGGPERLRTGGEEAGAGSAPVVVRVGGDAGPSQGTALIRGALVKRKRGRPKG